MTWLHLLGGLVAAALLIYLLIALFNAEEF